MFHVMNENKLYDFVNELEVVVELLKGKKKYDILQFLDDISVWMEHNKEFISNKYLPLGVLSVGITPLQISAFLYGLFVGKALEKNKVKVKIEEKKVSKDKIIKVMDDSMQDYSKILNDLIEESKPNDQEKKPEK